jgi:hypothetical protein
VPNEAGGPSAQRSKETTVLLDWSFCYVPLVGVAKGETKNKKGGALRPLVVAPVSTSVTCQSVQTGPPISPEQRIRLYSPDQWEEFIEEWAGSLKNDYADVVRLGGAGDEGRDVVAYVKNPSKAGEWDNYQCKHYDHALHPGDAWLELAKLCHYTQEGNFTVPRTYYFVAPQGVGTSLSNLIDKPEKLREELVKNWPKYCMTRIEKGKTITLSGPLKTHVERFDFSIVRRLQPKALLARHEKSPHFLVRFGGGLPQRPPVPAPPPMLGVIEVRYVEQLLLAYGEHLKAVISSPDAISDKSLKEHFARCRVQLYSAEALRAFSRDTLPAGMFEKLQDEMFKGVIDTAEASHSTGLERARAVLIQATVVGITSHPLITVWEVDDRCGICHQLVNDSRLHWVKP